MNKSLKILAVCLVIAMLIAIVGCPAQTRTKYFGGTSSVELPKGKKLVVVTWKDDNIWYLTRPMKPGEAPETYEFNESAAFGVWEGKLIIKETK